ncbi:hypothetical protein [Flammeovirga sp. EKP202]|uniref:hypothetical protein n=1 Tax=Flammeovirga sp. EKP202 TaxID=2770592 RepID=UPI00165F0A16|nr:hypothetical protein [Flammeovirga sp. EKP202]MBD0404753.1 hypothetical protein [Flammeovirga sp. EKP202]
MLTPEEKKAENALDNCFKGSIETIKDALEKEDLYSIREIVGNITVWSGHLGDRPKWLTPFSTTLQELLDKYGSSDTEEAKKQFFIELRVAYEDLIIKMK